MKNICEFNRSYFEAIISLNTEASNILKIDDKLCKNIIEKPENYFSCLAGARSIIVLPIFTVQNINNTINTKNEIHELLALNEQYLLLIRHLAASDIRKASMITGVSQELCRTVKELTVSEIKIVSAKNRALFSCALTNKTLSEFSNPKIVTLGAKKGFSQHIQQLSMITSAIN
ncbi:MAG: hypothetical protein WCH01_04075 [Methylococcaceae bacterium]